MRPLCCGMRSHPSLLSLSTGLNVVVYLSLIILSAGCLVVLILPNFYLGLLWVRLQLARRNAVYERANGSDNGKASASMNVVSWERFTPEVEASIASINCSFHEYITWKLPWASIYPYVHSSSYFPEYHKLPAASTRLNLTLTLRWSYLQGSWSTSNFRGNEASMEADGSRWKLSWK